ncbi:MAG: hypothetical protein ACRDAP_04135, partial [Shewanella sp.]
MTDRPTNNPSRLNTPPPVSGATTSSASSTTDTTQIPITAVTSQTQTTPLTTSNAITTTTSALPSTAVTSAIGATAGALPTATQQRNYQLGTNIGRFHTDSMRALGGSNRCGEYSILFLCRLFGIPEAQIPIPVRSPADDYNYLDLMTPLGVGRNDGAFGGDQLNNAPPAQIQCINNATQALLDGLDRSCPYLLTTSAVSGGHTLALFFNYTTNCWSVYNSQATPPVVSITDPNGVLNGEGLRLLPSNTARHFVDYCPMSPHRVHFLMRYIYRLHMTQRRQELDHDTGRSHYVEHFANFESRVLRQYRDEAFNAAISYSTIGSVPLPNDFDPALMFTERPPSRDLPPIYESPALRRQPAPAAFFGPRPSQYPCPEGYEDYFGHALLGSSTNANGDPFQLQSALEVAGFISGDINNPQNGDLIIP